MQWRVWGVLFVLFGEAFRGVLFVLFGEAFSGGYHWLEIMGKWG